MSNFFSFNTESGNLIEQVSDKVFLRKDSDGFFVVDYEAETVTNDHEWSQDAIEAWKAGECREFS